MFRRINPATGQYVYEYALIDEQGRLVLSPDSPAPSGGGINVAASADVNTAVVADVDAAVAASAGLRLVGFAAKESAATAAAATFNIVHGATGAAGTLLVPVELSANESTRDWFGPDGIAAASGISIDWVAGQVDVVLFYKVVV
jgi:hypothetical protein